MKNAEDTDHDRIVSLEHDVATLQRTLGTLIAWMAQAANSPIRESEAKKLIAILDSDPEP